MRNELLFLVTGALLNCYNHAGVTSNLQWQYDVPQGCDQRLQRLVARAVLCLTALQ
jgi:hypothetical protein